MFEKEAEEYANQKEIERKNVESMYGICADWEIKGE